MVSGCSVLKNKRTAALLETFQHRHCISGCINVVTSLFSSKDDILALFNYLENDKLVMHYTGFRCSGASLPDQGTCPLCTASPFTQLYAIILMDGLISLSSEDVFL